MVNSDLATYGGVTNPFLLFVSHHYRLIYSSFSSIHKETIEYFLLRRAKSVTNILPQYFLLNIQHLNLFRFLFPLVNIWPKMEINSACQLFDGIFSKFIAGQFLKSWRKLILMEHNFFKILKNLHDSLYCTRLVPLA